MQAPWIPAPLRGKRRMNAQADAPEIPQRSSGRVSI